MPSSGALNRLGVPNDLDDVTPKYRPFSRSRLSGPCVATCFVAASRRLAIGLSPAFAGSGFSVFAATTPNACRRWHLSFWSAGRKQGRQSRKISGAFVGRTCGGTRFPLRRPSNRPGDMNFRRSIAGKKPEPPKPFSVSCAPAA